MATCRRLSLPAPILPPSAAIVQNTQMRVTARHSDGCKEAPASLSILAIDHLNVQRRAWQRCPIIGKSFLVQRIFLWNRKTNNKCLCGISKKVSQWDMNQLGHAFTVSSYASPACIGRPATSSAPQKTCLWLSLHGCRRTLGKAQKNYPLQSRELILRNGSKAALMPSPSAGAGILLVPPANGKIRDDRLVHKKLFAVTCTDNPFAVTKIYPHGFAHSFDGKNGGENTLKNSSNSVGWYSTFRASWNKLFTDFHTSI